jgi:hypothetical protein
LLEVELELLEVELEFELGLLIMIAVEPGLTFILPLDWYADFSSKIRVGGTSKPVTTKSTPSYGIKGTLIKYIIEPLS